MRPELTPDLSSWLLPLYLKQSTLKCWTVFQIMSEMYWLLHTEKYSYGTRDSWCRGEKLMDTWWLLGKVCQCPHRKAGRQRRKRSKVIFRGQMLVHSSCRWCALTQSGWKRQEVLIQLNVNVINVAAKVHETFLYWFVTNKSQKK